MPLAEKESLFIQTMKTNGWFFGITCTLKPKTCIKKVNRVDFDFIMTTIVMKSNNSSTFTNIFRPHFIEMSFLSTRKGTIGCPKTLLFQSHRRQDTKFHFHRTANQKTAALKQKIKGNACCCHGEANIYVTQLSI